MGLPVTRPVMMRLAGEMICVRPSHHLPVYGDPAALREGAAARAAAWRQAQLPPPYVPPPPWEIPGRQAVLAELPVGARSLATLGHERGFVVACRYGRGPYRQGVTDRSRAKVCDMVRVSMLARGVQLMPGTPAIPVGAVGYWADGQTSGALWCVRGQGMRAVGVEALKLLIGQVVVVIGR